MTDEPRETDRDVLWLRFQAANVTLSEAMRCKEIAARLSQLLADKARLEADLRKCQVKADGYREAAVELEARLAERATEKP